MLCACVCEGLMRPWVMRAVKLGAEELTGGSLNFEKGLHLYWHGGLFCF